MEKQRNSFEWDEAKRLSTLEKHGIDFLDAIRIFHAPRVTARSDRANEVRFISIGPLMERFVAVIYTIRGDAYRIISARRARDGEIRAYHESYPGGGPGA